MLGERFVFKNEQIQTKDVVLMNDAYCSSGSFEWVVRSKYVGHNICIGRINNLLSKSTPIHGPLHKYDPKFSCLRSHFSWLP